MIAYFWLATRAKRATTMLHDKLQTLKPGTCSAIKYACLLLPKQANHQLIMSFWLASSQRYSRSLASKSQRWTCWNANFCWVSTRVGAKITRLRKWLFWRSCRRPGFILSATHCLMVAGSMICSHCLTYWLEISKSVDFPFRLFLSNVKPHVLHFYVHAGMEEPVHYGCYKPLHIKPHFMIMQLLSAALESTKCMHLVHCLVRNAFCITSHTSELRKSVPCSYH